MRSKTKIYLPKKKFFNSTREITQVLVPLTKEGQCYSQQNTTVGSHYFIIGVILLMETLSLPGTLFAYFKILRPFNCFLAGIAVIVGAFAAFGIQGPNFNPHTQFLLIFGCMTTFLLAGGGYTINDVFDLEIDKVNQPNRPIPAGIISPNQATLFSYFLFGSGIALSIVTLNPITIFLVIVASICLYLYARGIKGTGLLGNLLVSFLTSVPLLYGGLLIQRYDTAIFPTLFAFLLTLAREIVKDIEDVTGDKIKNIRSLPLTIGIFKARTTAIFLSIILILIGPIPVLWNLYNPLTFSLGLLIIDILLIIALVNMIGKDEDGIIGGATLSKKLMKATMAVGILSFFFASVI